jgi:hypothetical protein
MTTIDRRQFDRRKFLQGLGFSAAAAALIDVSTVFESPVRASAAELATSGTGTAPSENFSRLSKFTRLFPNLPPFRPDRNPNTTVNNLAELALSMSSAANAGNPNGTGAIYTYWGQFIDHDLTRDLQAIPFDPAAGVPFSFINPTTLTNFETFVFDLSSLYNTSPAQGTGAVFASDGVHMVTQEPNPNGVPDVPRNSSGVALIGDPRNDENEIVVQVHHGFLRFHNAVVDALGITNLGEAQAIVTKYYQWAILNDFLPTICGPDVPAGILNGSIPNPYPASDANVTPPLTPVEWSTAAYRLHPMVRTAYLMNNTGDGGHPLFDGTDDDLHGGRQIPAANAIDFGNFVNSIAGASNVINQFNELQPVMSGPAGPDASPTTSDTDTGGAALYDLPIGGQSGAEPSGSDILAFRNLIRGFSYGDPSGQDVAQALGQPVISPTDAIDPSVVSGFESGTPLWYYLLQEAQANNPQFVGPSAARIIAGSFIRIMGAEGGILSNRGKSFTPEPPIAPAAGQFGIADLLLFAGVATQGE